MIKDGWLCLKKENAIFMYGNMFGMFIIEFMFRFDIIVFGMFIVVSFSGVFFDIGNWYIDFEVVSNVSVDGN